MPIEGDKFVPLHAYKALSKIAVALLPVNELHRFKRVIEGLKAHDEPATPGVLQVGFSYSYVGNAPRVLAGTVLLRKEIGGKYHT